MDDLRSIVADVPNISRAAYEQTVARIASIFYASMQNVSLSVLTTRDPLVPNGTYTGTLSTHRPLVPAPPHTFSPEPSLPPSIPPLSPPLAPPISHEAIYKALIGTEKLLRATLTTIECLSLALVLVGVMLFLVCTGWVLLGNGSVCAVHARGGRRSPQPLQSVSAVAGSRGSWPLSTTRATQGHVELAQLRPGGQEQHV